MRLGDLKGVNLNTSGPASQIGGTGYSLGADNPKGLLNSARTTAWDDTNLLYLLSSTDDGKLYQIDAFDAEREIGIIPQETFPTGLAWAGTASSDNLYMIGSQTHRLYTVNKNTGAFTAVGDLSNPNINRSIDYIGGILYALSTSPTISLFSIDPSNQNITRIGAQSNFGLNPANESRRHSSSHHGRQYNRLYDRRYNQEII